MWQPEQQDESEDLGRHDDRGEVAPAGGSESVGQQRSSNQRHGVNGQAGIPW